MPLEGLRWSRDSGSALYDTPQTAVLGRAGGHTRSESVKIGLQWIYDKGNCERVVILEAARTLVTKQQIEE